MPSMSWPFEIRIPVRFRDLDAMGHVNNAVYLTFLEQARNEMYLALTSRTDPTDLDAGLDFVVARMEADFLAPVFHGDLLTVVIRPERVGRSSFSLLYEMHRRDGTAALRGRSVQVTYDWHGRRSKPVPDDLRAALLEGGATA